MKTIINRNSKGEFHNYQELYNYQTNKLAYRGEYKNNNMIGYNESHTWKETRYHIR